MSKFRSGSTSFCWKKTTVRLVCPALIKYCACIVLAVKWLAWASQQADRLDPLTDSPPSVLDEAAKYKEERPVVFGGYGFGAATQAQDEAQLKSEFFRKRWLYDRFHGKSR